MRKQNSITKNDLLFTLYILNTKPTIARLPTEDYNNNKS